MSTKLLLSRRNFIKKAGLATIALATTHTRASQIKAQKPNILFIAVDDLRCQLGCYGHSETISPNIDKLAAEGTIFKRAFCQVPVCGPSRVSVLTGVRPDSSMWKCSDLKTRFKTLPALFRDNGYYAISNGKVFHHMHDQEQDWSQLPWRSVPIYHGQGDWAKYNSNKLWQDDESGKNINPKTARGPYFDCADVPDNAYQDGKVAEKTIADLKRLKDMDKPFFLACGFWRPHLPFNAPKKYWDLYKREDIKLADNRYKPKDLPSQCRNSSEINQYGLVANRKSNEDFHRQARHGYYACVSYVDAQIGKVLAELKRLSLAENTIVVLWGDHGWHLGEHDFWGKHNTLDNAAHGPLLVKAPGCPKNNKTDALVEFVDMYPTLCELTGIDIPVHVQGSSFVPLLKDPAKPWKKAVFTQYAGGMAVRTDRYFYTQWQKNKKVVGQMLFDHENDPQENENIANKPENAELVKQLSKLLEDGYQAVKP